MAEASLEQVYMVVYLDALMVKTRAQGVVANRAVYVAVGMDSAGRKDVLGLWVQATEGAKFWMSVLSELHQRGVADILVLCADGLTGMSDAVEAIFPQAIFQTCIVHRVRSSTRFVPWKERRALCADLRLVDTAHNAGAADEALRDFETRWGQRFPMIAPAWRRRSRRDHALSRLPRGDPARDLHHQRRRVLESPAPQGPRNTRAHAQS